MPSYIVATRIGEPRFFTHALGNENTLMATIDAVAGQDFYCRVGQMEEGTFVPFVKVFRTKSSEWLDVPGGSMQEAQDYLRAIFLRFGRG